MVKSIVKTAINAIWVILVCLEISQVIPPSRALGYILIIAYMGVLIIAKPMHPLIKSIHKPDINIPLERQVPNKVYSIVLLTIKIILLIACIGIIVSGAILYRFFLLRSLAIKIHYLCTYWAFLAASIQLGVNTNIVIIPKLNNKSQKACHYTAYLGVLAAVVLSIKSRLIFFLFNLNEDLISISTIHMLLLLIGCVSVGVSVSHLVLNQLQNNK